MIPFILRAPAGFTVTAEEAEAIAATIREANDTGRVIVVPHDWDVLPNAVGLVTRLREIHERRIGDGPGDWYCGECGGDWPCATVEALDVFAPQAAHQGGDDA